MGDTVESVFSVDVHGHIALGVDLAAGVCGGCEPLSVSPTLSPPLCAAAPTADPSTLPDALTPTDPPVSSLATHSVRLQTQHMNGAGRRHKGVWSCFVNIIREEKVQGLFKGMASPIIGVAIINSLLFGVYGSALRGVSKNIDSPTLYDIFCAGSISGFVNGFFSTPMELVKIRLQNQDASLHPNAYNGPIDCIRKIASKDGLRGLYRGLGCTLIRETPSYGAYFASYELLARLVLPPNSDPTVPSARLLLAGGLAGVVGWLSTYPFDVIKTRLQSIEEDRRPKYRNMVNAFNIIVREEGYRVFFSGLGATALRAFPTNAATFYVVVWVKSMLNNNLEYMS